LLLDALAVADRVSRGVGVRLVEVVALHASARSFYLKYGFHPLRDDANHLYITMSEVQKLRLND